MAEAAQNDQVQALFTRGRHLSLSVIYLAQNLFHKGKHSRDMSFNKTIWYCSKILEMLHKLCISLDKCIHTNPSS